MRTLFITALTLGLITGCDGSSATTPENCITGTVLVDGKPAQFPMILFRTATGEKVSGPGKSDGTYRVDNPPQGKLTVTFVASPPIPDSQSRQLGIVPAKYITNKSDLTFDYAGGRVTQDFTLTP